MKLFGRRTGRDGSRPALSGAVSRSGVPITGGWPRSYEAQLREGFAGNAVVQRAVRVVADALAGAPLVASDPALIALASVRSGGQALLATVAAHLMLHGNAYIQVRRDGEGGVAELYALRPERVSVETDAGGWPAAYRYRVGERVERLAANPIWSLASPSASYGMTLSTLHDLGLVPEAISVCNHMAALVGMIVAGAGVALLPEILVRGHLAKFELVRLLPEMPETRLAFVVAWQGAAEQAVLRHVVELARQCTSFDIESSSGP